MCNILVVEDEKALEKMWTVRNELDNVKKIVVYTGKVTKDSYNEDVMTWAEVIALGNVLLQILQQMTAQLDNVNWCAVLLLVEKLAENS